MNYGHNAIQLPLQSSGWWSGSEYTVGRSKKNVQMVTGMANTRVQPVKEREIGAFRRWIWKRHY